MFWDISVLKLAFQKVKMQSALFLRKDYRGHNHYIAEVNGGKMFSWCLEKELL